ncbi:MAG TPA: DUF222 domain-containing protein [Candidatus Dormibacteraeota bacterium]|nr:DUF222 domain-containing protein [Candidatus Dormibacteraeota bacterium]
MIDPVSLGEQIARRLVEVRRSIDDLELEFARLATEFDRTRWWDDEGFNTAGDWIRFNCHMNSHAVVNAFAVGATEREMPATMEAVRAGEIGFAHVATMARTACDVGGAFDENKLLPLAKEHSPGKFFHKCVHYRHAVDAEGYNRDQERLAEERGLRLNTAQDGCLLISGLLDPVGGAVVRAALEPLARPSGAHDDRTLDKRNADALVELASGGKPAGVQITATLETLQGLPGAAAGEMDRSAPVSSATTQRLACDATITRVLLSQDSLVVDVGRSKRVVDGALRTALTVRDKHCQWPECERPASWCDGHHLVHWINGGETNLENCMLLCKRHHRMVHEGGWQIVKTDEGEIFSVAPTVTFGVARGPD